MSDIHIPNHDAEALETAIRHGVKNKVNCIVIGGDLLDNTPFSRFDHKPTMNDARQYFVDCIRFLSSLRRTFPNAKIILMEGNHDAWYKRWLITKAPMLFNDSYYQLPERLGLNNFNIEFAARYYCYRLRRIYEMMKCNFGVFVDTQRFSESLLEISKYLDLTESCSGEFLETPYENVIPSDILQYCEERYEYYLYKIRSINH